MGDAGKPTDWITMKIDPEIFEELGVRDPEETKREMAITKKTRQVSKELKSDPDNLDLQIELATLMIDGANYEEAIKQLLIIRNKKPKDSIVRKWAINERSHVCCGFIKRRLGNRAWSLECYKF